MPFYNFGAAGGGGGADLTEHLTGDDHLNYQTILPRTHPKASACDPNDPPPPGTYFVSVLTPSLDSSLPTSTFTGLITYYEIPSFSGGTRVFLAESLEFGNRWTASSTFQSGPEMPEGFPPDPGGWTALAWTERRGPKGDPGTPGTNGTNGTSATITGATATALAAGAAPTVTAGGTATARSFTFGIPAGAKGDKGDKGDPGAAATITPAAHVDPATGSLEDVINALIAAGLMAPA